MATAQMDTVMRHAIRAVLRRDGAGCTDGQLLAAFVDQRDETAFEALVRRHGPMVFGVCRRVVGDHHDAEDAFQATFLVLARKASSVRPRERVANWLHGVAFRTAMKAKAMTAKRRGREKQLTQMPEPEAAPQASWRELRPLLDQELNGLPDIYRLPILLCDLEGKTVRHAAQQLGWPQGSLAGRLARGRRLLAKRLASRGVALSAGALAAVLSQNVAWAGVPAALMSSTVKAVAMIAARQSVAGVVPAKVAALMEGVMKSMMLTKLSKAAVAGLLVLCLCGLGAGGLHALTDQEPHHAFQAPAAKPKNRPATEPGVNNALDQLEGTWRLVSLQGDGVEQIAKTDARTMTLNGGRLVLKQSGKLYQAASLVMIDTSAVPWRIDLRLTEGGKGTMAAIVKVEGDTLKWCQSCDGAARPKEFGTVRGDGLNYSVWKRAKPAVAAKHDGPADIVTTFLDNLGKNRSPDNLKLFVSPYAQVTGIGGGKGPDKAQHLRAMDVTTLQKQQHVPITIDSTEVDRMDDALAVVRVKYHNAMVKCRGVFTLASEGGQWRIASLVYELRPVNE